MPIYIRTYKAFIILLLLIAAHLSAAHGQNIQQGIVGYWPFDCNAEDYGPNALHGKINGSPVCTDGKYGMGLQLDGSDDYIELPAGDPMQFMPVTGFTWSVWVRPLAPPTSTMKGISQTIISCADASLGNDVLLGFGSETAQRDNMTFHVDASGGFKGIMDPPATYKPAGGFDTDTWYHIVGVCDYNSGTVTLYIDNQAMSSATINGNTIDKDMTPLIGAMFDGNKAKSHFNGIIDEVRIWDRPLAPSEIDMVYNLDTEQLQPESSHIAFEPAICSDISDYDLMLTNKGPTQFNVSGGQFKKGSNFSLAGSSTFTLANQETRALPIRFNSSALGSFEDTLLIYNTNAIPPLLVIVQAARESLTYTFKREDNSTIRDNDTLDFGLVCPDRAGSAVLTLDVNATFKSTFSATANSPFSLANNAITPGSASFALSESRAVPLIFESQSAEAVYVMPLYVTDPCSNTFTIYMKAEVYEPSFAPLSSIPEHVCPGAEKIIDIPIFNNKSRDVELSITSSNTSEFIVPDSFTLQADADASVSVTFTGGDAGLLYTNQITFSAQCGVSRLSDIEVEVDDLSISLNPPMLNLGDLVFCTGDTTISTTFTITNDNIAPAINVTDIVYSDFLDVDLIGNSQINMGESRIVEVKVMAQYPELRIDENIEIMFDTCNTKATMNIGANTFYVEAMPAGDVSFGKQLLENTSSTFFRFDNSGSAPIVLEEIWGMDGAFSSTFTDAMSRINPGEQYYHRIDFNPTIGPHIDTLYIQWASDCSSTLDSVIVSGTGVKEAKMLMTLPERLSGRPGDIIKVGVEIMDTVDIYESYIDTIKAELNINPSLFIPLSPTPKGDINEDGRLIIPLSMYLDRAGGVSTLATYRFKIALGNSEADSFRLQNVSPADGYAFIRKQSSIFILKGVCYEGGTRLTKSTGTIDLQQGFPNPTAGPVNISYEIIEKGQTELSISSISGETIAVLINKYMAPGRYFINYDMSSLGPGSYYFVLKTPSHCISKKMQVIR